MLRRCYNIKVVVNKVFKRYFHRKYLPKSNWSNKIFLPNHLWVDLDTGQCGITPMYIKHLTSYNNMFVFLSRYLPNKYVNKNEHIGTITASEHVPFVRYTCLHIESPWSGIVLGDVGLKQLNINELENEVLCTIKPAIHLMNIMTYKRYLVYIQSHNL